MKRSFRLIRGQADGAAHRGFAEPLDLSGMARQAGLSLSRACRVPKDAENAKNERSADDLQQAPLYFWVVLLGFALLWVALSLQADVFAAHGEKALVLLFIRTDCPVSNRYAPELERLYEKYSPVGIDFRLVYPEAGLTDSAMKEHVRAYGYSIPAVLDAHHDYVARAKAKVTPEAAVFVHGDLVYLGRIDDWFVDIGKARQQPATHDLEDELATIAAGKVPKFHETRAVGCVIENLQ